MAGTTKNMTSLSDSSSSDDEELKRCQEAVWETSTVNNKDGESKAKGSRRVVVADHDHDGNELQVTKGFQKHVAKKLGSLLDSSISEIQSKTTFQLKSMAYECSNDDEGFRLFSTSIPGQKPEEPPPPVKKRPAPSSSDSDSEMEMRLKEAAVSIEDLLPSLTVASTLPPSPTTSPGLKKVKKKKKASQKQDCPVKEKKKRKLNEQEIGLVDSVGFALCESNEEHANTEQNHTAVKRKKKKRNSVEDI